MRDETDKLLQELGAGAAARPSGTEDPGPPAEAARSEGLDRWRILLVEVAYYLNACFRDVQYWEGIKTEKDSFNQLARALLQLREMPQPGTAVRIDRRGTVLGKGPERPDYEIGCAAIAVDTAAIAAVIKRMGIRFKHLEGRLLKAFETFAAEGMEALTVSIPDDSPESIETLRASLRVLSCFRPASEKGTPITFTLAGEGQSLAPVRDEKNQPDANLTLLAAVNRVPAESVEEIVRKVAALMQRPEGVQLKRRFPNVYQALFAIKSVSARLQRAPIEINASRRSSQEPQSSGGWTGPTGAAMPLSVPPGGAAPMSAPGSPGPGEPAAAAGGAAGAGPAVGAGTGGGAGSVAAAVPVVMSDAELRAGMAPFLETAFAGDPGAAAGVMQSLNLQAYSGVDAEGLGERLGAVSRLLESMAQNPAGVQVMEAISQRIQEGMEALPPDLLNDLSVQGNRLTTWDGEKEKVVGDAGEKLAGALEKAKDRTAAARRMRAPGAEEPLYLTRNVQALAQFLELPIEDMEAVIKIFRGCFDGRGNFQKAAFEKRVPEFARYPKQIFRVLWEFLKDMPRRSDRLPFLNTLQLMIKEIRQPIQAVNTLLSDLIGDAAQVAYPDRNAMMLATQFLRTYSKEINIDIELTPEEILLVRAGLDPKVVNYAAWKIRGEQKRFLSKVVTIRKRIMSALEPGAAAVAGMPVRFLLALEREVHIFMAIVGGDTAASILHNALAMYGNPELPFYAREENRGHLPALVQHISVLIRGLARVGAENDLILLDQVGQREKDFMRLSADPRHAGLVRRVFSWIEPARKEITGRTRT
jgi:hypothetical protein